LDIVHPIDFHSGSVEVVTIRPNASAARNLVNASNGKRSASYQFDQPQPQHVYEKHKTAGVHKSSKVS
jgi:hypothetical protein